MQYLYETLSQTSLDNYVFNANNLAQIFRILLLYRMLLHSLDVILFKFVIETLIIKCSYTIRKKLFLINFMTYLDMINCSYLI